MKISEIGINLIKKWEGYGGAAYKCPSGVWTIGYGHTSGVREGMTCTKEQAEKWLIDDVGTAEKAVMSYDSVYNWHQNQFDALVSFTFNCGAGNLNNLTQKGTRTIEQIAAKILEYNKSNGKTLTGLVNRRKEEQKLFLLPDAKQEYYPSYTGSSVRIDEVFHAVGADADYNWTAPAPYLRRKPIATVNHVINYKGSAADNLRLIKLAKEGRLKRV